MNFPLEPKSEAAQDETAYLCDSPRMRQPLIEASQRTEGIPFEAALKQLAI